MYDNFWWLGCIPSVSEVSNDVKISFLHPHASYIHLILANILWLLQSVILAKVCPNTAIGCTYT
jgi:hypothetical protein